MSSGTHAEGRNSERRFAGAPPLLEWRAALPECERRSGRLGRAQSVSVCPQFHFFLPTQCEREFSFWAITWLCQPPSIFPISTSLSVSAIYCLVFIIPACSAIRSKILAVSSTWMDFCKYASFCSLGTKKAEAEYWITSHSNVSILVPSEYRCTFGKCMM